MNKVDIKITQVSKQEFKDLQAGKLVLNISGDSVNASLVNSLRRLAFSHVPTYAFCKQSITIEENTSIFNNDYMRLRLSQLTYPNLKNPIVFLPERYWKDVDYSSRTREKFIEDKQLIEIYINKTNNESENINVTSNDMVFLENGNTIPNKINPKFPHLIIQLRPGESFKCKMEAVLGVGMREDLWAAAANVFYDQINEDDTHNYKFTIESQGQMDEYEILKKSCQIMIQKIEDIKHTFNDLYNMSNTAETTTVTLKLENEDFTIGAVINEFLQLNKNIIFSGISKPDHFIKEVYIKAIGVKSDPMKYVFETLDFIIELYTNIEQQITKLGASVIQK